MQRLHLTSMDEESVQLELPIDTATFLNESLGGLFSLMPYKAKPRGCH